ncbi:MAG: hypothetical protein ACLQKA_23975 [Bryobacteraceae bacterium]
MAAVRAEDYSLTFVFGPGFEATAKKGAEAAAAASHRWLAHSNATVELRRAGSLDGQRIYAKTAEAEIEPIFENAALQARTADPAAFLSSLDAAAQAAALRPGIRLLVAVLNSPPLSSEMERTVEHLADLCQAGGVRVIVLDAGQSGAKEPPSAMEKLTTSSRGRWVRHASDLEGSLEAVAKSAPPAAIAAAAPTAAAAPPTVVAAMAAPPAAAAASEIPIYARFIRTAANASSGATGTTDATGSMRGTIMAEVPLSELKFQVDETAKTYLARATIFVIVRNSQNAPVWSGQKEMYIHGQLSGLGWRQQGSMFFMRQITLPAGDGLIIDAKVQDLLAGTSGRVRTPLRSAPGPTVSLASDALFVRPFKAAADKLDADEVLSYNGETLSPVLDPRFPSGEDLDLQIYLLLYPNVHDAPPEMSLDLAHDRHAVAHIPMQFGSTAAAPDGKPGKPESASTPVQDGQPNPVPYLANVKRAQLAAGSYDAIVNIRQGPRSITREVAFRVMTGVSRAVAASPAKAEKQKGAADGAVVMPEIEPATIDSSGLALSKAEQQRLWEAAATNAREYSSHLPNFRCTRETHRFSGLAAKPETIRETKSFRGELTFEDGRESYRIVQIDGDKTDATLADVNGVRSRGEFGSLLAGVFDKDVNATYKWAGRAMAMGVLCQVFEFAVPRSRSNITLTYNARPEAAAYTGRVFIDEETGMVRRITILGSELPPDFGLQAPSFSLEYGMVRIGTDDYLLPLRSVMQIRQLKMVVRNESVFREYRKFEAQSGIKFDLK